MMISSISIGFYSFLVVESHLVTIEHPSLATYQQLYQEHAPTLQCPCSQLSIPYGTFLNITYVLHQVCFSDLVAPIWISYVSSFDPTRVPPCTETGYSRDFRTIGASYFQFLATVCSITEINLENARHVFINTQFITDRLLAPRLFNRQTEALFESFSTTTGNDYNRTFDWINFIFYTGYFLIGTNINFQVAIDDNDQIDIATPIFVLVKNFTRANFAASGVCSCLSDGFQCSLVALLYTNTSDAWDFRQVFMELPVTCLPSVGFLISDTAWWYNERYLENIRETYSMVIDAQSLVEIKSLNASVLSRFEGKRLKDLLHEMLIERWVGNETHFDAFYKACTPLSYSYTIIRRRDIIAILLLIVSICGGLNSGLRIIVPFIGKLFFFCADQWKNRNISDQGKRHSTYPREREGEGCRINK